MVTKEEYTKNVEIEITVPRRQLEEVLKSHRSQRIIKVRCKLNIVEECVIKEKPVIDALEIVKNNITKAAEPLNQAQILFICSQDGIGRCRTIKALDRLQTTPWKDEQGNSVILELNKVKNAFFYSIVPL